MWYYNVVVCAAVVELADAPDSKSGGLILRVGSTPTGGTIKRTVKKSHLKIEDESPRFFVQ